MTTETWETTNQSALMAELAALSALLRGQPHDAPPTSSSALDALCARFQLSAFERRIVLLCAGIELDGDFANQCAAAPGSGGNPWPSFGLALAAFPDAHWDALAPRGGLRHWRLLELVGNGPLVANRLQIDERILFFLTGIGALDERLVSLVEPVRETAEIFPSQSELLQRLEQAWQSAFAEQRPLPVLQLCGGEGNAKRALAARLSAGLTINLFRLPALRVADESGGTRERSPPLGARSDPAKCRAPARVRPGGKCGAGP